MLDTDTRRRIDAARDILVGKVPDPKSQVEQITIALIYKFMDDMDAQSEEMGGRRSFFAGEFERFRWANLVQPGIGGHETLSLYAEAITRMPENPGVPPLFRNIFRNTYLPYRDPETLRLFLKEIDWFSYDDSERLGDAFEYLLSVLGAQGDAGQFRTPRHIIDFIVAVLDPKKDERVLDPACGTAGFLISAYKHILAANTDEDGASSLTPDDRSRLADNFTGYDISPDMVRLSLVNMYLHGFKSPDIREYDTLTSEEYWDRHADVILANPPFMSPKGGIRPHRRFSVQSKRSEVLFVDYMAEHLTSSGRAGIIVPEGVIFQSQTAHTQLRKMLVEGYLIAVVSLPAGVFQPYSGVKTSILILDRALVRRTNAIAFFKVERDGFDLGAQRRPIEANDLPLVQAEIAEYLRRARAGENFEDYAPTLGLVVERARIAESGDYNLSAERYREREAQSAKWPMVRLGDVSLGKPQYGSVASKTAYDNKVRYVRITDIMDTGELKQDNPVSPSIIDASYFLEPNDLLIARSGSIGRTYLHGDLQGTYQYAGYLIRFRIDSSYALPRYVFYLTHSDRWRRWVDNNAKRGAQSNINAQQYSSFQIPLPPLDVQREIVAEIEGYQRVIDGASAVLKGYRPHVGVDPSWPVVRLGDVCSVERGASPRPIHAFTTNSLDGVNWIKIGDAGIGSKYISSTKERITLKGAEKSRRVRPGDFLLSNSMSWGRPYIVDIDGCIHDGWLLLRSDAKRVSKDFLYSILTNAIVSGQFERAATGGVVRNLNSGLVRNVTIPLPSMDVQQAIAAELDAERALVEANRELIGRMEARIASAVGRVWGEG